MLSQSAWRIGRAFTQGKKSAPAEFAEVEREADGLSEALQLVAETLNSDCSILDKAEDTTKFAVATILDSAQRTLSDLESFVARYRIIKSQTGERSWSDLVLANYKTLKWTTEGGDITALRDMLNMHTSTINLTMQALQSRSLARLERVVMPMAENVASIHDRIHKIDDVHRIIMAIANGTPALTGQFMHQRANSSASDGTISTLGSISNGPYLTGSPNVPVNSYILDRPFNRQASRNSTLSHSTEYAQQWRLHSACYQNSNPRADNGLVMDKGIDWDFESGAPPTSEVDIGDRFAGSSVNPSTSLARKSWNHVSNTPRRESMTLPNLPAGTAEEDTCEGGRRETSLPVSVQMKRRVDSKMSDHELPPPAPSPKITAYRTQQPATPPSVFSPSPPSPGRRLPNSEPTNSPRSAVGSIISEHTSKHSSIASSTRLSTKKSQHSSPSGAPVFEKALFRNAAILCDVRCTLVEFAQHDPNAEDPRFDTEMVPLCHGARVCVIRKRENRENGGTRIAAAIWTISDDGELRCQQKLPDVTETVPYCSFFEPEKVAIPPPTGGEILLRLHGQNWGDPEEKDVRTKWINYVFDTEKNATAFQSAIFGRKLLGSFRTTKTTVLHEGFKGAFAFEEQFANIEVLRLWEDDGVNTPGGSGGVMALLHLSGNFGQGYAKWWMNSSRQQVRVKDEHNKFAKLKGIDIRVLRPVEVRSSTAVRSSSTFNDGASLRMSEAKAKKGPERNVTGVRIEFKTEEEKGRFVEVAKRVQERMLPLPDI